MGNCKLHGTDTQTNTSFSVFVACMQTNQHRTVLYYEYNENAHVYNPASRGYTGLSHAVFIPCFKPCARLLFYVVVWSLVNASAPGLSLAGCHGFEPGPLPNTFRLYHLYFNVLFALFFFKKASHLLIKYINKFLIFINCSLIYFINHKIGKTTYF